MKAIFNNEIIAESEDIVIVEHNHYFPADSVKMEYLKMNDKQYKCPWKGVCDYYDVEVDGQVAESGAYMYPKPNREAKEIKGRFAFWNGVTISE